MAAAGVLQQHTRGCAARTAIVPSAGAMLAADAKGAAVSDTKLLRRH